MLGAQAVVLGTVNRFVPHPELRPDTARGQDAGHEHRHDAPVVIIGSDRHDRAWEVFAAILAVVSVVGIVFLLTRPRAPAAEAGIQARLVDVESGEVLWQAKESFNGGARSVQALVTTREDQKRIAVDVEYLARILCRELTQTLLATNGGTIGN
jgi:hypothetical protein